jgi:hypothetical protein
MAILGVPAGTYGSNLRTAIVSVDTQGKVYQISNVSIAIPAIANVNITTNLDYPVCLASSNTGLLSPNVFISNTQLYFNPNTATLTSINFNTVSDISLKDNILEIKNPISMVSKLSGVEFNWKDNGRKASGFIAQDVEKTLPHLVNQTNQGFKTINYQGIIAYLVETVKELNDRIQKLENKNGI